MSSFVNGMDQQNNNINDDEAKAVIGENNANSNVERPSSTANMWNDTQHPPTHYLGVNDREIIFTHNEWIQLRNNLFALKQQKDTFMCEKAYRFSMQMNALQDIYSFPNATVCKSQCIIAAGKCAEAAAQIFLPPDDGQSKKSVNYVYRQKANGDQYVYKIKVWGTDFKGNPAWVDSLDAQIKFLVSQKNIVPNYKNIIIYKNS